MRADPRHVLDPIAPVLSDADLTMVNLETAVTDGGEPVAGKNYHFRSPAATFAALKAAGVDVVNMANNHALDYGPSGMQDTFAAIAGVQAPGHRTRARRDGGVPAVPHDDQGAAHRHPERERLAGAGARRARGRPPTRSRGIAFSIDRTRLLAAVQQVRPEVDTLVVFLHWGTEDTWCASGEQQDLATALLGAGADIIVGSHTHRVFGAGKVGPALVAYGTGQLRVLARRRRIGTQWRAEGDRHRARGRRLLVGAGPDHQRRARPADRRRAPPPTWPSGTPAARAAVSSP